MNKPQKTTGDEVSALVLVPGQNVLLEDIADVATARKKVFMSAEAEHSLCKGRTRLEERIAGGEVIYGVNTGFGGNSHYIIPDNQLAKHQDNLLTFLSAGTGNPLAEEFVRAAQFLTVLALLRGWSAVRPEIVVSLVDHLNHGIVPVVPRHGSVGASGDLIPSSYIASAICGQGLVQFGGRVMAAADGHRVRRPSSGDPSSKGGIGSGQRDTRDDADP